MGGRIFKGKIAFIFLDIALKSMRQNFVSEATFFAFPHAQNIFKNYVFADYISNLLKKYRSAPPSLT